MQAIAKPTKHGMRPDPPISPIIHTRQEIFQGKRGVCFNGLARHERSPRTLVKVTPRPKQIISFKSRGIAQNQRHPAGGVNWKQGMFQEAREAESPFSLPGFYYCSVRRLGQHYS
jgi:hypothetical protein